MVNVTTDVATEVVPELANIDIMFKAIIIIFVLGFIIGIVYVLYNMISN